MRKEIIIVSVLLLAVFIWAIESHIKSPPSVEDVISSIENQDSFCWRAELTDNLTKEEIFACVNYKNQSAFWKVTSGNGNSLIRAFPGDEFYGLNWDLALHSKGVEWNVMNFAAWVLKEGTIDNVTHVSDNEYEIRATLRWVESYAVGTIENGHIVRVKNEVIAFFRVNEDGKLLGGRFIWKQGENCEGSECQCKEKMGSFEVLGPWGG
ncbi:hypothetical protein [Thermococcus sp. MAR1]|uniref:hypothetical protein n=1 Tax=Thermococcus sp. MAR1 TaxID=1638263 RepID=UPI00143A0AB8|nr:hypothetical protein [Thermococcus sp. MAR1]NJE09829.1 hypothetical protein [Thermococcus sp. MAR1]